MVDSTGKRTVYPEIISIYYNPRTNQYAARVNISTNTSTELVEGVQFYPNPVKESAVITEKY